ncbi:MAG: TolC family protein, partial [Elusimicrobiaceae bacterium]|nr:TolC family protein [Elusimicrobiaceae bacterium]
MKKIVFLFIILISFSAVNIFSQETLSLDNAIRLGIKNNSQLLSQEQEMIIASQRVTEAKFLYLPIINFSAGTIASNVDYPVVLSDDFLSRYIDPNNKNAIYSVGVVAKQYLYAGGRHKSTVRLAKSYLKEAQNGYDTIKNNASFDIKQKFYEAVYKDERLTTSQKFLGMTKKIIANISDYSTKMQAEIITLTEIENDIHAFTNEAEASKLQLIKSLNKELDFD